MTKYKIPALAFLLLLPLLYMPPAPSFLAARAGESQPTDFAADDAHASPTLAVKKVSAGGDDEPAAHGASAAPSTTHARSLSATPSTIKFNFRKTVGHVTDEPGEVYVLPSDGPGTTRGGVTFGWANTAYVASRDGDGGSDRRFGGVNYPGGEPGGIVFQVELPSAGTWRVRVALGDYSYDVHAAAQIYDGSDPVAKHSVPPGKTGARGRYKDAMGDVHASADDWLSANRPKDITFTSTVFKIRVGTPGNDQQHPIAHLVIEPAGPHAGAGPDKTVAAGRAAALDGQLAIGTTFLWEQVSGTPVTITGPTGRQATYTVPTPSGDSEVLTFRLTVDGVAQDTVRHFVVKADADDVVQIGDPRIALLVGRQLIHGSGRSPFPQFDAVQVRRALYWAARVPDIPPITLTGTVSVLNGGTTVNGVGTRFTKEVNLATGDPRFHRRLCIRDCSSQVGGLRHDVTVLSVQSDTQLTLASPWAHSDAAGAIADTDYYVASDESWNRDAILSSVYYDLPFTLYQAYYRSGNPDILAAARRVALTVWRHPHFREGNTTTGGESPSPREAKLQGLWIRHLESGETAYPKLWDWSDMYVRFHFDTLLKDRDPAYGLPDTREAGYAMMYAAYLSQILPDSYPDRPGGEVIDGQTRRAGYLEDVEDAVSYFGLRQQDNGSYIHDSPWWKNPENSNCTVFGNQSVLFSGILTEGLTAVHEVTPDPVVKASVVSQVKKYADNLWADFWRDELASDYGAGNIAWRGLWEFGYGGTTCDDDFFANPANRGAPVITEGDADKIRRTRQNNGENHHVFGFVYRTTGDPLYKTRGDDMFGASFGDDTDPIRNQVDLTRADAVQQKVYSQNMRSSGRYLVDRLAGVAAPSSLTVTAFTSSSVSLSWADDATNETGFKVERCHGSGCADFAQVAALGVNITTFNDLALDASTAYTYRVRAYNAAGSSAYSNTASATTAANSLAAPTGLSAKATSASAVHLSWAAAGGGPPVTHYEVYRRGASGYELVAQPTSPVHDDTGLPVNTAYLYRVRAVSAGGSSNYSNVELATTVVFTDHPLVAGVTVKAAHLNELRRAVGAARALAGLGPAAWTYPDPVSTPAEQRRLIFLEDLTELRGHLGEALAALGLVTAAYPADPPLARQAPVRKEHFMQIRARVE